jgi:hypothetical protein
MVGADRFDEVPGEYPGSSALADPRLRSVDVDVDVDGSDANASYWSDIAYPEPRARVDAPARAVQTAPATRGRRTIATLVAAALVVAGGAYALGRVNGHASVPGLHRQVATLNHTVASQRALLVSRAATMRAQAATIASDQAQLSTLRNEVSASQATASACQRAIDAADRAFETESDALNALVADDLSNASTLTDRFGTELDSYSTAKRACVSSTTSV